MRNPRPQHIALVSFVSIGVLLWYFTAPSDLLFDRYAPVAPPASAVVQQAVGAPESTWEFLRRANEQEALGLNSTIKYSRRCIRPVFSHRAPRKEVPKLPGSLTDNAITMNLNQPIDTNEQLATCVPIDLTVPVPYSEGQYPDLIFGMATLYERMGAALPHIKHWASGRDAKLIVILSDYKTQSKADISMLERQYSEEGIYVNLIPPIDEEHSTTQSHFMVLVQMVKESDERTKWFGLLDDDTFFPHLGPLSDALGRLDHLNDMYVGGLSEDFGSVAKWGIMAYGGGGAFLSLSLAKKLGSRQGAEECLQNTTASSNGDIILKDCVFHHSKAGLTILPGLYQHDLTEDLRGFYESGVEVLSLHHWKSWYNEPVVEIATAANYCGNCFLQRWQFGKDAVLSNGYSISIYRSGLAGIDLNKTEVTWNSISEKKEFDYAIGPMREKVGDDERKTYKLRKSEINGVVMRQLYLHKAHAEAEDEIIELIWSK